MFLASSTIIIHVAKEDDGISILRDLEKMKYHCLRVRNCLAKRPEKGNLVSRGPT